MRYAKALAAVAGTVLSTLAVTSRGHLTPLDVYKLPNAKTI